jgi:hypothetical protein
MDSFFAIFGYRRIKTMHEITLCRSERCKDRKTCLRALRSGTPYTSYSDFYVKGFDCNYYIKVNIGNDKAKPCKKD